MTRPPASRRRDLGPILAIAAAVIAGVAIIAGFMVVGGPGHARDARLDDITDRRIDELVALVQCAFNATGLAPITAEAAQTTRRSANEINYGTPFCGNPPDARDFVVKEGVAPTAPGDVTYGITGPARVRVCAYFRAARDAPATMYAVAYNEFSPQSAYPQLSQPRPGGTHCYEIDLVRTIQTAAPP